VEVGESLSRRSSGPRYARLVKRPSPPSADDEDDRLTMSQRAVPTNFRFAGLGKRRVSLAYKAAGLGKRASDNGVWDFQTENRPEEEIGHNIYDEPVFGNYADLKPELKRRVSTAMRYAGLGKRHRGLLDADMK